MLKFGICRGSVNSEGLVKLGKAIGYYGEGYVDEDRLQKEIIPDLEERDKFRREDSFPVILYTYHSTYMPSKTKKSGLKSLGIKTGGRGLYFEPRKQLKKSKTYEYFITDKKEIFKIKDSKLVRERK